MLLRLKAIGFHDTTEEALLAMLNTLMENALRTDPSKLITKPFEECSLTVSLSMNGQPKDIEISLGGTPQACLPYKFENHGEECFVSAFTCTDGKPIAPIWFWTPTISLESDFEMRKVSFVEIYGFAETLEKVGADIDDIWIRVCDSDGILEFQGVALSVNEYTNSLTKNIVTLCRIYLPGIVIPVCTQGRTDVERGTTLRGTGVLYGHICPS